MIKVMAVIRTSIARLTAFRFALMRGRGIGAANRNMFEQCTIHAMTEAAAAVRVAHSREAVPWHTHSGTVFVRVDSGERTLMTADAIVRLPAGSGASIPAGQAHAFAAVPPPGSSYRAIRIAADPRHPSPAGRIDDSIWQSAFDSAYEAIASASPQADAAVARLVATTSERLPHTWQAPTEPGAVRRARRLAETDPTADLRLPALAHAAGMSAFHLHRLYRRLWGVTPAQHRLETRLRIARAALLAGASVAAAAAAAGFADQSHLTRMFRRFMGVPPQRWRRQVERGTVENRQARAAPPCRLGDGL
jgi:AraC-like DNA-binding protein